MMHRVVKPFAYSADGIALVDLNVGDERDFGSLADGLLAEGWVEPVVIGDAAAEVQAEGPVTVAADEPAEVLIAPRPVRKRK